MITYFNQQALPLVGSSLLRFLGNSIQWNFQDPLKVLSTPCPKSYLFGVWHNRLLMMPYIYEVYFSHRPIKTLISQSRDGEKISAIAAQFGFRPTRGSSSKKGALAFRDLIENVRENFDIGLTPDGPRGPRYEPHLGIIQLSQLTQRPIVPILVEYESKWELRSWDRFQIPKPLTKAHVRLGTPHTVPRKLTEEELQAEVLRLKTALLEKP